ncbi:MAG: ComEC/Rec2 family competence protein, partial [Oscillospiraceae bacterium]
FNSENIYVFANVLEQKSSSNIFLLSDISTILSNRVKLHIKNPQAEIANAMTFGKKDINLITNYNLIKAGIVHITAVSGLHVGIIATIIFLALKKRNTKTILLAVLLIWAYAFFVGLSFSVIRASLLFTAMFLARLFGRKNDTLSSLMLSATIILLINPTSIASVSFQLTYLSVLALIVFYPILCKKIHSVLKIEKSSGFLKLLIDSFSATVAITIFTLPVIMGLSNGFSLTAFIINPIVIAITPIIIVVTFILSITSFFPILLLLNQILAFIIESLTSFIIFLSESISIFIGLNNLLPFTIIAVIIILIVYFIKSKWVYNAVFICVSCILLLSIIPIRDTNVYSFIGFDGYSAVLIEDGKVNIVTKNCD